MNGIKRAPAPATEHAYDLAIIGGGVYGIMIAYEAVRRGQKCILVERDDFGGHTTFNWLRILHGGLRYLQSLDLVRFRESVGERRWFIRTFPEHVQVLPCLMPLYNRGIRRTNIFRLALLVNDLLSRNRNKGILANDLQLPNGKLLDSRTVRSRFPNVDPKGLAGGALWYDAIVPDSQRLIIDLLKAACRKGAVALNYVEARRLITSERGQVAGITVFDKQSKSFLDISAPLVINAAGPWCREIADSFDQDIPELFYPSIAWNLLIDRPGLSSHALALSPPWPGAHTYFLITWKDQLLVGTGHRPWLESRIPSNPQPTKDQIKAFLNDLNATVPELNLKEKDILHIFGGFLPAAKPESARLANRHKIVDHSLEGGPKGLFSLSGVKFTTSRLVADQLLSNVLTRKPLSLSPHEIIPAEPAINTIQQFLREEGPPAPEIQKTLLRIARLESAFSREDLLTRRLGLIPPFQPREKIIGRMLFNR
jgi:glycerol-3-phosphate dehydrogenase